MLYTLSPKVSNNDKCKFNSPHFLYFSNPCDKKYEKLLTKARESLAKWYGDTYSDYLDHDPSRRPKLNHKLIPS